MLLAGKPRQGPIYERLLMEGEELKRQKELAAEEHAKQEAESIVGHGFLVGLAEFVMHAI